MHILFGGSSLTVGHEFTKTVPSTIQSLHLTNCFFKMPFLVTQLNSLLVSKQRTTPTLKEIMTATYDFDGECDFASFKPLAHQAGVFANEVEEENDVESLVRGWKAAGCTYN